VAHARAAFAKWHQVDLDQGRCIVFRFPDRDKELVLVPVRIKTGTFKQMHQPIASFGSKADEHTIHTNAALWRVGLEKHCACSSCQPPAKCSDRFQAWMCFELFCMRPYVQVARALLAVPTGASQCLPTCWVW
jgi:hypothetical protein